ncbi:stimulated by retinoic acid gene 8 protein homolog [Erinaceus europaeus]|uniref:Stimulated by retinoic acid gene 8 protein homolog n=1 Tax=Erinaceus europaeus TaxID=9365 RepID=A0ABM3XSB4_ERIEU|nr:stimulated by retinoic acid gene 8 protein homolog [Erinaceus europaeus]
MADSGEGSNTIGKAMPQLLAQPQRLEPRVARRRLSQARHRATLSGLFSHLRKTVYSHSDFTASKWQILNRAKNHIHELEQTLDSLLKLKESLNLMDGHANSLEEAKEEYANVYSKVHSLVLNPVDQEGYAVWYPMETVGKNAGEEEDEEEEEEEDQEEGEEEEVDEEEKKVNFFQSPVILSPDLMEFERYLKFYKQTVDLLTENGIVSAQEVMLPIVSAAISHLWQTLPEEMKTSLLQTWSQNHSDLQALTGACQEQEPICTQDSVKDSGVESQGASCSLFSTPEEILFEDAFDVASYIGKSEAPSKSSPSSMLAGCNLENPEEKFQLYMQIIDFFKGLCCINTQFKEEETNLPTDDEMMLLRCLETFEDEDV